MQLCQKLLTTDAIWNQPCCGSVNHLLVAHNCHLEPSILLLQDTVELIHCIVNLRLVRARVGRPECGQVHHIIAWLTCSRARGSRKSGLALFNDIIHLQMMKASFSVCQDLYVANTSKHYGRSPTHCWHMSGDADSNKASLTCVCHLVNAVCQSSSARFLAVASTWGCAGGFWTVLDHRCPIATSPALIPILHTKVAISFVLSGFEAIVNSHAA